MKFKPMLLSLLAVTALASCGGGTTPTASSQPAGGESTSGGSGTKTKIDLTVWAGETNDSLNYAREVAAAFNATQTEYEYNFSFKPVSEASVSGDWSSDPENAADFAIAADDQIPSMISAGHIQNLEALSSDKFIPGLANTIKGRNSSESIDVASANGKTYGFPVSASNGYILYYNTEFINKEDTTSFESLLAAIKRVSERDGKNYRFGFPTNSGWYLDGWFRGAGFSVYGEPGKSTVDCDWDQTKDGVSGTDVAASLVRLAHGEYRDYWTSQKEENLMTQVDASQPKRIIATINGTWSFNTLKGAWGDDKVGATVLPTYNLERNEGKTIGMQSVKGFKVAVINAKRKSLLHSAKFAEFFTNYENQKTRFEKLSELPTNTKAAADVNPKSNPAVSALADQWERGAFTEQVNAAYWGPSNGLCNQLTDGTAGELGSFIKSGAGTSDLVLDYDNIAAAVKACVDKLGGKI